MSWATLQAFSDAKRRYTLIDLHRWAAARGATFTWPTRFPMLTLLPLRVACQLDLSTPAGKEFCARIFGAYWGHDEDISQPDVIAAHLTATGLDAAALLQGTQDPAVKKRLIDNTEEAVARGVFGAPSFFVGDDLFFGQDRFEQIATALSR